MVSKTEDASRQQLAAMGRPRKDMLALINSDDRLSIQEHIWKVFMYHDIRKTSMKGWLETLNKFLPKLQIYNIQKGNSNRNNFEKPALTDYYVTELFEEGDLRALNVIWSARGFPVVFITSESVRKIQALGSKFVNCILNPGSQFSVRTDELS